MMLSRRGRIVAAVDQERIRGSTTYFDKGNQNI
jgi:hypothetical protein